MDFSALKLLVLDVDGVLTDGRIVLDAEGESVKVFDVRDGCALTYWKKSGGRTALLSGRESSALQKRGRELGVDWVHSGVSAKLPVYEAILKDAQLTDREVAYVGDDLPDLPPLYRAGLPVAVADAVPAVKRAAWYITRRSGGRGAVAEVVELILRKQRRWAGLIRDTMA